MLVLKKLIFLISALFCAFIAQGQTACPPNIDFEQGNLNYWTFYTGSCCPISTPVLSGPVANRHVLTSGSGLDHYGQFPIVCPGGSYSFKLGNDDIHAQAERARYTAHVPPGSGTYLLIFKYAVVLQDPGHLPPDQPRFQVSAYDSATNLPLACANFEFVSSSNLPGFQFAPVQHYNGPVYYKDWAPVTIDLSNYHGKTIIMDFASGDCAQGGHFGYGYIDLTCTSFQEKNHQCEPGGLVTLTGPPGFQIYQWYSNGFTQFVGSGQSITINKPPVSTIYSLVISPYAGYGCPDTLYTEVELSDLNTKGSRDTFLCRGETAVQLHSTATGSATPFAYSWQPAGGLSCTNCTNPVATIFSPATYIVAVTDTFGCVRYDTVHIYPLPKIKEKIVSPDSICQFDTIEIKNVLANALPAQYFFDVADGMIVNASDTGRITATWSSSGQKKITLHVANAHCETTDSAFLYVKYAPRLLIDIPPNTCVGDTIYLKTEPSDGFYHWAISDHLIPDTLYKDPIALSWPVKGTKTIGLSMTYPNGCKYRSADKHVFVQNYPAHHISVSGDFCIGHPITLTTDQSSDYIYDWRPVPVFINGASSAEVQAFVKAKTMLTLTVTDRLVGCAVSDTIYADPQFCCDMVLPDAFTPNGDGLNDVFHILTPGKQEIEVFMVIDRWSQVLFKATSINDGWDGSFKGKLQDNGTYYYYIKYRCDGVAQEKKGNFILLR